MSKQRTFYSILKSIRGWLPVLLVYVLTMGFVGLATDSNAFTLYFDTKAYSGETWLQVQDPNVGTASAFSATYAGGTIDFSGNLMSEPVKLSDIGANGLNIDRSVGAVLYVFYDDPSDRSRTSAPAHMTSKLRFQPLELTMNGGSGDQGNLTAINYFTAPMKIESYKGTRSGSSSLLQEAGFETLVGKTIGISLEEVATNKDKASVKDDSGTVIRWLGPSNYSGSTSPPWPSFVPYMKSARKIITKIQNENGFSNGAAVYQFGCDMSLEIGTAGNFLLTGLLTVSANQDAAKSLPSLPQGNVWSDARIRFEIVDRAAFNNAIYGQVINSAVNFQGTGWDKFKAFAVEALGEQAGISAYETTCNMIIGEVTTGILGGFVNSDVMVNGKAVKDMPSHQWWKLNPMQAFADLQPDHDYYNLYANVIYEASNNTVYGIPYSDRLGQGPLVNTVQYKGTGVDYWVVKVGKPLGCTDN